MPLPNITPSPRCRKAFPAKGERCAPAQDLDITLSLRGAISYMQIMGGIRSILQTYICIQIHILHTEYRNHSVSDKIKIIAPSSPSTIAVKRQVRSAMACSTFPLSRLGMMRFLLYLAHSCTFPRHHETKRGSNIFSLVTSRIFKILSSTLSVSLPRTSRQSPSLSRPNHPPQRFRLHKPSRAAYCTHCK